MPATAPNSVSLVNSVTLVLRDPVTVNGKPCRTFTLREPKGSDLRGIMLTSLAQGSVAALAKLLSRIANPPISEAQVEMLALADQVAVMGAVAAFFGDGSPGSSTPEAAALPEA